MPIYEYHCQNCRRTLEKRQKFSDPELTVCPFCEGKLEKMISAPAVQFKGGGWYADGYGNKSAAKSTSSEGSGGDSKSSTADPASTAPASAPAAPASTPAPSTPSTSASTAK